MTNGPLDFGASQEHQYLRDKSGEVYVGDDE